jgi:hypothetical protein
MKLDNYIYLTICEESFKLFKKTNFSTYNNYCKTFYLSLSSNDLSSREKSDLISLLNVLDLIYGLDDKDAFKYIMEFLACDKILDFELYVREMYNCYPLAFN